MSTITVTVPESASVTAADLIAAAARRAGHTPEHEATASQFLAAHLADYIHQLYQSAMVDAEIERVRVAVPRPERPRMRQRAEAEKGPNR